MKIEKKESQTTNCAHPSSFRDPSGFLFYDEGFLFRQINFSYRENYERLLSSGLYDKLIAENLIIAHKEIKPDNLKPVEAYKIIQPESINFISYPYEWCFGQLKDAALATLKIQKMALTCGLTLKDASAYNMQFHNGQPILIDTLSFEIYDFNSPWIAYKQFCQHFLAPLAIMSYNDIRLGQLSRIFIDGIPLDLAARLLPFRAKIKFPLLAHIVLHAKSQKYYSDKKIIKNKYKSSFYSLTALINNLEKAVRNLSWQAPKTEWSKYYDGTNYTKDALAEKKAIIENFLDIVKPQSLWDFGSNSGLFSRLASEKGIKTVSFDIDWQAVESNYQQVKEKKEKNILPLWLDMTNPSSDIGWANSERQSLIKRGPVDMIFALALIHHLAIANNLPFSAIAKYFSQISEYLAIEFIPKEDSNAQRLLAARKDIFPDYGQLNFEKEFGQFYLIIKASPIKDSKRILYLMQKK